jgi:hypothetical protein
MGTEQLIQRLREELFADDTAALVRTYFTEHSLEADNHAGRYFGRLGGISDDEPDPEPDRFVPVDLVATATLGRPVPGPAALQLLGAGRHATVDWERLLGAIPVELHISSPEGRALLRGRTTDDQPRPQAGELWRTMLAVDGVDAELASRLLHRKRPKLLPITDTVTETVIGPREAWWAAMADWFEDEQTLPSLVSLRGEALEGTGVSGGEVSLVRMVQVVLWMRHRAAHVPICA